jgi:UDP-glucose 4-epimerase
MGKISKVLVTGGAGFIGSNLIRRLLADNYSLIVLDNFRSGSIESISRYLRDLKLIKGDIRNRNVVKTAIKDADAVVHLAALIDVEESVRNPSETNDVNVNGTLVLLEEASKGRSRKFLFASSTAVYGDNSSLPLKEDYPLKPVSPYAASKASGEHYCRVFNKCYGLPTVILRFFNVYGPGQKCGFYSGVITRFLNNASNDKPLIVFGDGEQTRDFIYIDDVVDAIALALESESSSGQVLNVCTGRPTSINRLATIVLEVTGKKLEVTHENPRIGDVRSNYGDPQKAKELMGFRANVLLKQGLVQVLGDDR